MRQVKRIEQTMDTRPIPRSNSGKKRGGILRAGLKARITLILCFSLLLITTSIVTWLSYTRSGEALVKELMTTAVDLTVKVGLKIKNISIEGQYETKSNDLFSALGAQTGDPILTFDPSASRQRILKLGWVASANIERRFPNTIFVHLRERIPIAVWKHKEKFLLVDSKGTIIGDSNAKHRENLTLIIGPKAPNEVMTLLPILRSQPQLMERLTAASRVEERRWNLRIDNRIDVRLPEKNPQTAWDYLAKLQADHKILERDIIAVDLRVPERLVVRIRPAGKNLAATGEHT